MAVYSLSLNTTVTTTGAAAMDLRASAANGPRVMEVGLKLLTGTASTYALGRSGNTPTQTSPVLLQAENPGDPAAVSGCAVAWSVAPTLATQVFRRVSLPATVGAGVIWTFPRGISMAVSTTMLIWNLATNSNSMNAWWVVDE